MALSEPRYIRAARVSEPALRYTWDDWQLQAIFDNTQNAFRERMGRVSYRAALAFTIATGEWIVHRFDAVSDDPEPLRHMEAMWAGVVDSRYVRYWEPPDEYWLGPIRGPLRLAIIFTLEAMVDGDACGDVGLSADRAVNVAVRVLPNADPYLAWRERVVERLERLYPFDPHDPMGDVVPREALDPDTEFDVALTNELVNHYLRGLSPSANDNLAPPEEMLEREFPGTPYRFDIQQDRIVRNAF
jgi:hypothetical protein